MAWLHTKVVWFKKHLVQLQFFWTSNALIFAKWQHLKQGYFYPFQGQQLSYIVLDKIKSHPIPSIFSNSHEKMKFRMSRKF